MYGLSMPLLKRAARDSVHWENVTAPECRIDGQSQDMSTQIKSYHNLSPCILTQQLLENNQTVKSTINQSKITYLHSRSIFFFFI